MHPAANGSVSLMQQSCVNMLIPFPDAPPRMRRRLRLTLASLALLMLFAQQGALLHALAHAMEDARPRPDLLSRHADVCPQCVAFAALGAGLPAALLALALADRFADPLPGVRATTPHLAPRGVCRTRAPPFLV